MIIKYTLIGLLVAGCITVAAFVIKSFVSRDGKPRPPHKPGEFKPIPPHAHLKYTVEWCVSAMLTDFFMRIKHRSDINPELLVVLKSFANEKGKQVLELPINRPTLNFSSIVDALGFDVKELEGHQDLIAVRHLLLDCPELTKSVERAIKTIKALKYEDLHKYYRNEPNELPAVLLAPHENPEEGDAVSASIHQLIIRITKELKETSDDVYQNLVKHVYSFFRENQSAAVARVIDEFLIKNWVLASMARSLILQVLKTPKYRFTNHKRWASPIVFSTPNWAVPGLPGYRSFFGQRVPIGELT